MGKASEDKELLKRRNKLIVEKYAYLYDMKRKRFEDVMYSLKWDHFFLSESKIKSILRQSGMIIPRYTPRNSVNPKGLSLQMARNNKIITRFNELSSQMRYDDLITQLASNEFFLHEVTVERIVRRWQIIEEVKPNKLF